MCLQNTVRVKKNLINASVLPFIVWHDFIA